MAAKPKIDFSDPNWANTYLAQYGNVSNALNLNGGNAKDSSDPIRGMQGFSQKNANGTFNFYDPQGNLVQENMPAHDGWDFGGFAKDIAPGVALLGGSALGMNALAGNLFGGGSALSGAGADGAEALLSDGSTAAGGSDAFTWNAAADSQAANAVIDAAGGNALAGYAGGAGGLAASTGLTNAAGANVLGSAALPAAGAATSLIPGISNGQLATVAAPLVGGLISSNAASTAADKQAQATADSNALLKYMYDNNVKLNQPAMDAGNTARTSLMSQLGLAGDPTATGYGSMAKPFTGADLTSSPGYQFGLNQGQRQIDQRAANSGGYFSGAALKAAQRFGQDYAGTKFNDAFNQDQINKTTGYNQLAGLTGGGQTATNQITGQGNAYAGQVGSNLQNNANAQGAAGIAGANSWGNALTQAMNGYNNYNTANSMRNGLNTNIYSGGYQWPTYP